MNGVTEIIIFFGIESLRPIPKSTQSLNTFGEKV